MPYLTPTEYAKALGITRQAVNDRMNRGTVAVVVRDVKVKRRLIYVKPEEWKALALVKGQE